MSPPANPRRHLDLRRSLLIRVTLFAAALSVVAVTVILAQARGRIGENLLRTGDTIGRLINAEAERHGSAFRRSAEDIDLSVLDGLGQLIHFCAAVADLYGRRIVERCFAEPGEAPAPVRWALDALVGSGIRYETAIGQYPGIKVGELTVTPNLDREAADVWGEIRAVLWIAGGVLLLNVLVYIPVRRALRPTREILRVLGEMEKGDLSARLPRFELIELDRIGTVFNDLAGRLQATASAQRQLAQRLLGVREEERRHLARELHDELGQCLASINAEAAYANELARDGLPELLPCTGAIARTTGQMMESLQQILRRLRPAGLEEFGLAAGLEQLVEGWRQRSRGRCEYRLELEGDLDGLPDNLAVSLYRIVQESLTNAAKHGRATRVAVRLRRGEAIELTVEDDGEEAGGERTGWQDADGAAGPAPREPGLGVLGMHERVQAMGGRFSLTPRTPRGMRVAAVIPDPTFSGAEPVRG